MHFSKLSRRIRVCPALILGLSGCAACAAEPQPLPEVTITAKTDAVAAQLGSVTQKIVLDRSELDALGGLTVGEVIRKLPGVDAGEHSADGGMSARSRGMVRDSVQFLVNGERPTANARFALTQVGRMPSGELERVEILRGASAEFGGAAPVTVNLVMRRPVASSSTSLKVAAGQRGRETNGQFSFSRSGGEGSFGWLLPVVLNHHGMPVEQTTRRESRAAGGGGAVQQDAESGDYAIDEIIFSPRLAWKEGSSNLTLWPSYYRNTGERVTQLARQNSGAATGTGLIFTRRDEESSQTRIARLRADGEQRIGENKLSGRAAVMSGRRSADRQRHSTGVSGATVAAWQEVERRSDGEMSASLRVDRPMGEASGHFVSAGVDFARHQRRDAQWYRGSVSGSSRFDGRAQQWSLWGQDEWRVRQDITLTTGLRGETMNLSGSTPAATRGAVHPSLAARWDVAPGWQVRASSGGSIRFPRLEELTAVASRSASANSPLEPDRGGNPALRPERIVNFELGVDHPLDAPVAEARESGKGKAEGGGGIVGANLYFRQTRGLIERRQVLEGARWVERPWNEGDARHWGLEFSAKLRSAALPSLPKGASLRASLTLPRGTVEDQRLGMRRGVREMPDHTATLAYEQTVPSWQATFGVQWQRNGVTRTHIPGEVQLYGPMRNLVDAHVERRLDATFNLRLSVQNLWRADLRRHASAVAAGDAWQLDSNEAGQRTWLLSLEGKW